MWCVVSARGGGTQDSGRGVGGAVVSSGFCGTALQLVLGLSEAVSSSPWGEKKLRDI